MRYRRSGTGLVWGGAFHSTIAIPFRRASGRSWLGCRADSHSLCGPSRARDSTGPRGRRRHHWFDDWDHAGETGLQLHRFDFVLACRLHILRDGYGRACHRVVLRATAPDPEGATRISRAPCVDGSSLHDHTHIAPESALPGVPIRGVQPILDHDPFVAGRSGIPHVPARYRAVRARWCRRRRSPVESQIAAGAVPQLVPRC